MKKFDVFIVVIVVLAIGFLAFGNIALQSQRDEARAQAEELLLLADEATDMVADLRAERGKLTEELAEAIDGKQCVWA